eukprot:CAMPEP_0205828416 /NCGR_PEP_ID=MMETSP0206-20130828/35046_1 /ASSEMBLY_ACC=CAM_ASM_000279 /TAXON_ID=36767 /ORGANISM="Euplotes focardii, Strain TN1" /LENGTH=81 /DNA_ID=CAMNT_0053130213 /DNA_START=145 /DNA_END=387 /DNA_ORIENTATION=-
MRSTKVSLLWKETSCEMMPLLIVLATDPPVSAPRNSNTAPTTMAWLTVKALDPTLVPRALDTSWAPMAQAMAKPTKPLATN